MTVKECLQFADAVYPNRTEQGIKVRWLSEVEGRIQSELHGISPEDLAPIDESAGMDQRLCVPFPYDGLYWMYLLAMMEYTDGDTARYENTAALFRAAFQSYAKYLRREGGASWKN